MKCEQHIWNEKSTEWCWKCDEEKHKGILKNHKRMKISYAITVFNEINEIKKLLTFLIDHKRNIDEIVILYDNKNGSNEVKDYLLDNLLNIKLFQSYQFNNNFSEWKNLLNSYCTGDYIFNIDADEMPSLDLINKLPFILMNNNISLYYIGRINTVEDISEEFINKWGWDINNKGWINSPDWQARIYKKNLKWYGNVHETIKKFDTYTFLPFNENMCLNHNKTLENQIKQNNKYNNLIR